MKYTDVVQLQKADLDNPSDFDAVYRAARQATIASNDTPVNKATFKDRMANSEYAYEPYLIKNDGAKVLGAALMGTFKGKPYLFDFAIYPRHRGKGYGRQALQQLQELYKDKGYMALGVANTNTRAKKLYESVGFKDDGIYKSTGFHKMKWEPDRLERIKALSKRMMLL